jgi:hypothetical protein
MQRVVVYCRRIATRQGVIDDNIWCEQDLEFLGWERDLDRGLQRIPKVAPDMVIIAGREPLSEPVPLVSEIQSRYANISVIEIDLETDCVRIYGEGRELNKELKALLAAIVALPPL